MCTAAIPKVLEHSFHFLVKEAFLGAARISGEGGTHAKRAVLPSASVKVSNRHAARKSCPRPSRPRRESALAGVTFRDRMRVRERALRSPPGSRRSMEGGGGLAKAAAASSSPSPTRTYRGWLPNLHGSVRNVDRRGRGGSSSTRSVSLEVQSAAPFPRSLPTLRRGGPSPIRLGFASSSALVKGRGHVVAFVSETQIPASGRFFGHMYEY